MEAVKDYSEYWARLRGSHHYHPANRFRYWLIVEQLKRAGVRFSSVLDCGCGDGSLLRHVRAHFRPARSCGVDISAATIGFLQAHEPRSDFYCIDLGAPLDGVRLPAVELAICSEVIEHVPDDQMALQNLSRLVAPGGHLLLTTQTGKIRRTERFLGHLRHYDLGQLCAAVEARGFQVIQRFCCGWPWLNLQKIVAERFFGQVQSRIIDQEELSAAVKLTFSILYHAYRVCSRRRGPQLFILARKVAAQ
jgi:SAM-dependent methyltransferase